MRPTEARNKSLVRYMHMQARMKIKMPMQSGPSSEGDEEQDPLDVLSLARHIHSQLPPLPPSYEDGKTILRDAIMQHLNCSADIAESAVDRMEAQGLLEYHEHREGPLVNDHWQWWLNGLPEI